MGEGTVGEGAVGEGAVGEGQLASALDLAKLGDLAAVAGIEVTLRTSLAAGQPQMSWRNGYRVIRKDRRYMVFPRAAFSEMMGWHGGKDGLVEIWNGMPFFSPMWARTPHVTWLHHVHAEMWNMTLPPRLAMAGRALESRVAPPVYRRTPIVTLSHSSKHELIHDLGFKQHMVHVVPPGVDPRFSPGGVKSPAPLVAAVESWIHLPGHFTDEEVVDLYRRAWVLASASAREGWGMTLTEAAACGTPAVVTRIAGHLDAVSPGRSGLLADNREELVGALDQVLSDADLRARLTAGALEHVERFTWGATARGTLEVLAAASLRRRCRP